MTQNWSFCTTLPFFCLQESNHSDWRYWTILVSVCRAHPIVSKYGKFWSLNDIKEQWLSDALKICGILRNGLVDLASFLIGYYPWPQLHYIKRWSWLSKNIASTFIMLHKTPEFVVFGVFICTQQYIFWRLLMTPSVGVWISLQHVHCHCCRHRRSAALLCAHISKPLWRLFIMLWSPDRAM